MRERPILFSAPMVRALIAGTKTQTRRIVKAPPKWWDTWSDGERDQPTGYTRIEPSSDGLFIQGLGAASSPAKPSPYGSKGDRLWVRESLVLRDVSWHYEADSAPVELGLGDPRTGAMISWGHHNERERCNSIHMPRWASRITLEVTNVRVERLQSISEEDAKAEGVTPATLRDPGSYPDWMQPVKPGQPFRVAFEQLWDEINGTKAPWSSNPWLWVIGFRRLP